MTMNVRLRFQLLAFDNFNWSCFIALLTALISLRATTAWLRLQRFNNNEEFMEGVKNVAKLAGDRLL
jgi:hypothetical protein